MDDNGTTDTSDDLFEWSYTVTSLDGQGCDLSFWVLSLCPAALQSAVGAAPAPTTLVDPDPATGLTGVKWDNIKSGFTSDTFTLVLSQSFPTQLVTAGFKTGAGIIFQDVQGPSCQTTTPSPTPTVSAAVQSPEPEVLGASALPSTGARDPFDETSASISVQGLLVGLLAALGLAVVVAYRLAERRRS